MRFYDEDVETEESGGWGTSGDIDASVLPPENRGAPLEEEEQE